MRFRRINICMTVLAAVASPILIGCDSQESTNESQEPKVVTQSASQIVFLDPGATKKKDVDHLFHFVNITNSIATLEEYRTSCGCTKCSITPRVLKPGDSAGILIGFDLISGRNDKEESVIVSTNLESPGFLRYTLRASCYPRLELYSSAEYPLYGEPGTQRAVDVICRAFFPAQETPPNLAISVEDNKLINIEETSNSTAPHWNDGVGSVEKKLCLLCRFPTQESDAFAWGEYSARVVLDDGIRRVEERIQWKNTERIRLSPRAVFVNFFHSSKPAVELQLDSEISFSLLEQVRKPKGLDVRYASHGKSQRHIVTVTGVPESREGETNGVIVLKTDHPQQVFVHIPYCILR